MTVTWRKGYPTEDTILKDLPKLHSDNFNVIQSASEYEHYSPLSSNTLSGYHRLGKVGSVYEGTTVQINALSATSISGSVAYDTTLGLFKVFDGTEWDILQAAEWSRARSYLATGSEITVTADASANILAFDTKSYDTMGEYSVSAGVFSALASGYYLVNANVCFVASGDQALCAAKYPAASAASADWPWVYNGGSYINRTWAWAFVNEQGAPNESDYVLSCDTGDLNSFTGFSGSAPITDVPAGASDIRVTAYMRYACGGCVCQNTCYGDGCACDGSCHNFTCSCHSQCYGYAACSCNLTCYGQSKGGCTCYQQCYGYAACSCNYTTYGAVCGCYIPAYGVSRCRCQNTCYQETEVAIAPTLLVGGTLYSGASISPSANAEWYNYTYSWDLDPSTGLPWTAAGVSAIQGYGPETTYISSGVYGAITQYNLKLYWYPVRPAAKLHIYKNDALLESSYTPFYESAASATNHVASIASMLYLTAGDYIDVRYEKTLENDTISAGSEFTNFSIHRLTGPLG